MDSAGGGECVSERDKAFVRDNLGLSGFKPINKLLAKRVALRIANCRYLREVSEPIRSTKFGLRTYMESEFEKKKPMYSRSNM